MRRTTTAALAFLLLVTLSLGQDAAPDPFLMERILPPGALLHLSIPHTAAASEGYTKSNVKRFWEHPEIRGFAAPIEKYVRKRLDEPTRTSPSWNEQAKAVVGLTVDELWGLLQGPLTFTVYDVPATEEHKLDLVVSIGAGEAAKLQKAAASVKEALKKGGRQIQESEFKHGAATVNEVRIDGFPIFHSLVGTTLVLSTTQDRMEKLLAAAADKAFAAGLTEDPPFKAARTRVAPDSRHLLLAYLNGAGILKQFRREIGDEALRILDTLGVSDITSAAAALSYDGGPIRERYALITVQQTRGILKFLAGGTPVDAAAGFVPAGALSYSHSGLDLAEFFDVMLAAVKIDVQFEQQVAEMLAAYEKRVGLRIREALSTFGTSWTGFTILPEGGGLIPDGISIVSLKDAAGFEAALGKVAKDAGIPVQESSFRGHTLRWLSIPFPGTQDLGRLFPIPFQPSFTLCFFVKDGLLLVSDSPLSLKRQILRFETKPPGIVQDRRFQEHWARVPEKERESWAYFDFGRLFNLAYSTLEPFIHTVRDYPRDPETGELIVDLARMPLGEALADQLGATFSHKRTHPDAITIDAWSNTAVGSPGGVVLTFAGAAGLAAAVFVPRMAGAAAGGPANNERVAELSLLFVRQAQETFKNSDSDRNGAADYWTRDLAGLYGLKDAAGQAIFLLDPETAGADADGAARYGLAAGPKSGYFFKALVTDQDGNAYAKDDDKDGQSFTNKARFGVVAWPAGYGATGRFTFVMNESGKIWKKDTTGQPVDKWPGKDPAAEGWLATGE